MKIVKIAAGVVVALIVVVVIVLMTVDVNKYKGAVQAQVKSATGRDIAIGDMKLGISLSPAIVLSDVALSNASWGTRPQMLTLKKLEAHTQLIPLLFGTVNISGLKMTDADAYLETDANGKGNWEFDTPKGAQTQQSAGSSQALNVSGVGFEGLKLTYRDGKTKEAASIAAKTMDIDLEGTITDLAISSLSVTSAIADFKQGAKSGSGSVGKLTMAASGPITDFNITKVSVSDAKGAYADGPMIYNGAVASLSMEGAATKRTPAKPGQQLDVVGALKAMNVTKLTVEKVAVNSKDGKTTTTAEIGKIAVDAKGKIGDLGITNLAVSDTKIAMTGDGAPVDVAVDKLTLDEKGALTFAAKVGGQDVKANGTLAPVAALAAMNKGFPAKVVIEGMGLKVNTDITVDVSTKRPVAKGTVNIPELDLAAFAKSSGGPGNKQGAAPAKGAASGPMFSNDPLPWESLEAADADVKITIGKLTLPNGLVLSNVSVPVALTDGKLAVKPASFGVAGGSLSADLAMDAREKSLALSATAKGITAETIAKEMKRGDVITQGPLDLDVNVRGSGASPHAIATSLNGSFLIGMGESKIRSDALNIVGADVIMQVLSAVNPVGNKDPYTVARCGVANFQITGGVARTSNGIALVTDKMQLTSSGEINLGTERIDLSVNPKATGGLGMGLGSIVSAVRVTGPLASPGIGIDKAGAIKSIGTLGAAFATGGLSALAQGAKNRVEGGGDPCQTARTWTQKK